MAEIIVGETPVTTDHIAAEVARLQVVKYALNEARYLSDEGWGDYGHIAHDLALKYPDGIEDNLDTLKEQTLYSLVNYIPQNTRADTNPSVQAIIAMADSNAGTAQISEKLPERTRQYMRIAARYSLKRCGIIRQHEEGEEYVDGATVAAYAYFRADITEKLDRQVYDHAEEIEEGAAAAMPVSRRIVKDESTDRENGVVAQFDQMNIYGFMGFLSANADGRITLPDGTTGTRLELWWQELDSELERIKALNEV